MSHKNQNDIRELHGIEYRDMQQIPLNFGCTRCGTNYLVVAQIRYISMGATLTLSSGLQDKLHSVGLALLLIHVKDALLISPHEQFFST